jgi:hypothetical protein
VRPRFYAIAAAFALAGSGCAAERATTPSGLLPADVAFKSESFKRPGMTVSLPGPSLVVKRKSPAVFRATFGESYVSGLAYARKEQLPRSQKELRAAQRRLVAEVRRRAPSFKLVSASITRSHGSPAVEVVGNQVLDKRRLRTRSLHVYKGRAEYVLEMAAPVGEFGTVDRNVFDRVAGSLRVTGQPR